MDTEDPFILTSVRGVCRNLPRIEALPHAVQLIHEFVGDVSTTALPDLLERGNTSLFHWVLQVVDCSPSLAHHEKLRQYRQAMHLVPAKMTVQEGALTAMKELYARYPGSVDENAVYAVCEMAELSVLKWLYDCEPFQLFKKSERNENQIFIAASSKGRENVVRWLVGLFPDHVRSLEYAAEGGHLKLIRWLMKHAHWEEKSLDQAFENAVVGGHLKAARFLQKTRESTFKDALTRVKWTFRSHWMDTCFETFTTTEAAASRGHLEMIQWLYSNYSEHFTQKEMNYAAGNGHLEIVKFLHASCKKGWTSKAMNEAAGNGHLEVVQWLHEHRTECCSTDAMDSAAGNGHLDILEWLQDNVQVGCTDRAMSDAVIENHIDVAKWLYDNKEQEFPDRIVDKVAGAGNLEMVKFLHRIGNEGWSKNTMNEAASNGHLHVVKFLHKNRREGCTKQAMNNAAANNHLEVVKWLHNNRREGCSVLAINNAATAGHLEVIQWLHEHRQEGCSAAAMTGAARNGHVRVMEFLAAKFSVKWQSTAMRSAVHQKQLAAVKWLHFHLQPLSRDDASSAARSDNIAVLEFIRTNVEECITPSVYYVGNGNRLPEVVKWYEDHYGNPRKRKHA